MVGVLEHPEGRTVSANPMDHIVGFWRPEVDARALQELVSCGGPDGPLTAGINVWQGVAAQPYRVMHGQTVFSIYASVCPIESVPESAEVLADIQDWSGNHCSYVLWFADTGSILVPFDPGSAVESLRGERYLPASKRTVLPRPLLSLYYAVKPFIPVAARAAMKSPPRPEGGSVRAVLDLAARSELGPPTAAYARSAAPCVEATTR